ncbi:unnamed protein product [Phytophthora lilii]|uniref:Unnamed protein product n=1 Tax=Phytophthora lilii TaxID=2077276 RepID=A0A9W6XPZ4_9STRA|nr:unnamed protein product [Phytophthora lilii]
MNAYEFLLSKYSGERLANLTVRSLKVYGVEMLGMSVVKSNDQFWIQFLKRINDEYLFSGLYGLMFNFMEDSNFYEFYLDVYYSDIQEEINELIFPSNIWISRYLNVEEPDADLYDKFYRANLSSRVEPRNSQSEIGLICEYNGFKQGMIDLNRLIEKKTKNIGRHMQYDRCIRQLAFHPTFMNERMQQFDDIEDFFESMGC